MNEVFYLSAAIAIISTLLAITRLNIVHALLYFVVSLLAVSVIFFVLGAPFIAALEMIIYAGAIMVLFIFVVMMLNLGPQALAQERQWLNLRMWAGPSMLVLILIAELAYLLLHAKGLSGAQPVGPKHVGIALFGPYMLGAELASLLLMAGLIGAYHLGRRERPEETAGGEP